MCKGTERAQRGMTLVELVIAIVIIGIAVTGVLMTFTVAVRRSADPVGPKQALAAAEALLDEVELMPFTYCDPTDANVTTATGAFLGAGGCATKVELMGPEAGEARGSFNNVNDYGGLALAPDIQNLAGTLGFTLTGYTANVIVTPVAVGTIPAAASLLITVTVTDPNGNAVSVDGYRTRYAPNSP